ncbi:MAG: DUF5060 domain-containing protein [Chloroflexi bacterium]|nr:DUF5060 domain-containing protein [Chloroflexota bacterium]
MNFASTTSPPGSNPFDPETISVEATFTAPSGTNAAVPGFWYQRYSRSLSNNKESVSPQGPPEWRVRFTPEESGDFVMTVSITLNGQPSGSPVSIGFDVLTNALTAATGFITIAPNKQYFAARNGKAFPLVGENVCWPGNRGTYDYDNWFPALQNAGGNFARLWMAPWAFGIESEPGLLTRYRLDRAWQLDYVFRLAEQEGIYLLLCLEYHGMFETEPDYWGGNNNWPKNPYNAALGGPCPNQNAFFTNATAKNLYQKRLRYLVGRYGYCTQLLAWEFFNEIDNVYRYLNPADVASWHRQMGDWLRTHDPYRHLVTTSLTGGSDRSDLWTLPQLDFAMFHSYGLAEPAPGLSAVVQSFLRRYQKPVMIGEFGVNWQGWSRADDPYLRALRQGLWGGLLGGSVGTSMPWYWESLHTENAYPLFQGLADFVRKTKLGRGDWQPVSARQSPPPPVTVGALITNGPPFTARLDFNSQWGAILRGQIAVPTPESALESSGALNSFIHGTGHPELRIPCRLHAWFGQNARLVLHLNQTQISREGHRPNPRSRPPGQPDAVELAVGHFSRFVVSSCDGRKRWPNPGNGLRIAAESGVA